MNGCSRLSKGSLNFESTHLKVTATSGQDILLTLLMYTRKYAYYHYTTYTQIQATQDQKQGCGLGCLKGNPNS